MKNRPLPSPPPVPPATRAEVDKFLQGLQEFRATDDKPIDEAGIKVFLDKMTVGSQQAIARRIMIDIMKSSPSKHRDQPKDKRRAPAKNPKKKPKKEPKKKKASAKAKSKRPTKKSHAKARQRSPGRKKKAGS